VLQRKPGALPGATALAQARGDGTFTAAHDFWALARSGCGDAGGTRALVEVLLLHRHLGHADVVAGLPANTDALDVPAGLLWQFRLLAFATSTLLWAGLAVIFGLLSESVERQRPPAHPAQIPTTPR